MSSRRAQAGRVVRFAAAVFAAHGVVLAATVGYVGASRAISVGLETLITDHMPGLLAATAAAVLAAALGPRVLSLRELVGALLVLASLNVGFGFLVAAAVGEIDLQHVPQVVAVTTGLGTQLAAAAVGGAVRYVSQRGQGA